jgi:hypothetical protein
MKVVSGHGSYPSSFSQREKYDKLFKPQGSAGIRIPSKYIKTNAFGCTGLAYLFLSVDWLSETYFPAFLISLVNEYLFYNFLEEISFFILMVIGTSRSTSVIFPFMDALVF